MSNALVTPAANFVIYATPEGYPAGSAGPESEDTLMHCSHRRRNCQE